MTRTREDVRDRIIRIQREDVRRSKVRERERDVDVVKAHCNVYAYVFRIKLRFLCVLADLGKYFENTTHCGKRMRKQAV